MFKYSFNLAYPMAKNQSIREALLEMLRKEGGQLSIQEIYSLIENYYPLTNFQKEPDKKYPSPRIQHEIRSILTRLVKKGLVEKPKRAYYKIASDKSKRVIGLAKEPTKSIRSRVSQKSGGFEADVKQFVDSLLGNQKYESRQHKHLDISIHPQNGNRDTFKVAIECKGYRYEKPDSSNSTYDNHMKRASNDISVQQKKYPRAKYFLVVYKESDSEKTNEKWRKHFQGLGVNFIVWTNKESKDKLAREIEDLK